MIPAVLEINSDDEEYVASCLGFEFVETDRKKPQEREVQGDHVCIWEQMQEIPL